MSPSWTLGFVYHAADDVVQTRAITDPPCSHRSPNIHKSKLRRQITLFICESVFHRMTATSASAVQMWQSAFSRVGLFLQSNKNCLFRDQICCVETVQLRTIRLLGLQNIVHIDGKCKLGKKVNKYSKEQSRSIVTLTVIVFLCDCL